MIGSNLKKTEYSLDLRSPTKQKDTATRKLPKKVAFFGKTEHTKWISFQGASYLSHLCCTRNSLTSKTSNVYQDSIQVTVGSK